MIQVINLHHTYLTGKSKVVALRGIDLCIPCSEFVGIIGPNSSGKTTFARHLNGVLLPSQGRVIVDGLETSDPGDVLVIRRAVGMVLSNPDSQIVGSTVEEDVAFGPENLEMPQEVVGKRVDEALELTGLTSERGRNPRHLSNGQKQLLALAGILAIEPRYLVFDEVTSMLGPESQRVALELAFSLTNTYGLTVIWVTHRLNEVLQADRILVMNRGEVWLSGKPGEVLSRRLQLENIGLRVPPLAQLFTDLKALGLIGRSTKCTVEGIAEELCG